MAKVGVLVPAFCSTIHLGLGKSVEGFILPTGEFRYGSAYASQLLGYSDKYFNKFRQSLQGNKKQPKKLETLISKGFTGELIRVRAVRPAGGSTRPYTISFDDFCIWVEHEGFDLDNPEAKALLSASFREVLRGRTQEAFEEVTGKTPDSIEKRIVQFQSDYDRSLEREALRKEDYEDIDNLKLYGDRPILDYKILQNYAEELLHLNYEG